MNWPSHPWAAYPFAVDMKPELDGLNSLLSETIADLISPIIAGVLPRGRAESARLRDVVERCPCARSMMYKPYSPILRELLSLIKHSLCTLQRRNQGGAHQSHTIPYTHTAKSQAKSRVSPPQPHNNAHAHTKPTAYTSSRPHRYSSFHLAHLTPSPSDSAAAIPDPLAAASAPTPDSLCRRPRQSRSPHRPPSSASPSSRPGWRKWSRACA